MKYFLVEVDEQYVAPAPVGWYGIIDKKALSRKSPYQIAKHLLFPVQSHMQMVFTDILTSPCFMVSKMVRDVIRKYDSFIYFIRIILLDEEHRQSRAYYIPYLDTVEYTLRKDIDREEKVYFAINKKNVEEKVIVEMTNGHNSHFVMRMDLLESILRREAVGIGLKEVLWHI